MTRPVMLLDRDGVINRDSADFIRSVEDWEPIPGSLEAIARLTRERYRIVVITNQSGLARGYLGASALNAIHDRMRAAIEARGGTIEGIFVCPHHPSDACACRKPATGLIEAAERKLGLSARGAPLVGDKLSDMRAALRHGCRPVLVESGLEPASPSPSEFSGISVYPDLAAVVDELLGETRARDRA